jgi:hypothetical protein
MLADYLRQQQQAQQLGDFGYYDDFAGTDTMPPDGGVPDGGMGRPVDEQYPGGGFPESIPAPEPEQQPMEDREALKEQLGLTDAELDIYIRTGNLPVRRGRRGAGVLEIRHGGKKEKKPMSGRRAERAAIVKKVMRERGVKLGEASRIVKQEGLF